MATAKPEPISGKFNAALGKQLLENQPVTPLLILAVAAY
jgi:hypothetical protein